MMLGMLLAIPAVALAAELVTSELDTTTPNSVTVAQGGTTSFSIKVSATGNVACGTSHTATVNTSYALDDQANLTSNTPSDPPLSFPASCSGTGNGPISGGPFTVASSISADANTPTGIYTDKIVLSEAAGTTSTFDSNATGAKLDDVDATKITVVAEAAPVTNHATTVLTPADDANGNEGSQLATSGAFSDADGNGTLTITRLSGAGTVTDNGDGTWSWSHTPNDNTSSTQTVVVEADDGTDTVTDSFDWSAANVDPTGTLGNNGPKAEGSAATVSFSNPSDASSVDAASLHYAFDCQGGSLSSVTYATASTTNSKSCTFNDNGSYNVTGVIIDKDGGRHSESTSVTVTNANPVVGALSVTSPTNGVACLTGGNEVKLGFSFTDAGSADTHGYSIAWGDNSANTVVNSATSPVANVGHTYNSGLGPYTITVTVTDDDGGSGSANNSANPVSFHYNIGTTLLSPVNADNSSIFKLGSTIPLKVNITDCSGTGVTGLSPDIRMIKTSSSAPLTGIDEGISTQPNDANWVMRDSGNGQYIYNLASKSLPDSSATYKAVITHNGYSVTSTNYFGLKTK